jgi:hypothetical protein
MGWGKGECKGIKIEKSVLCSIKELHKRESCRPICKELKVLTVTALYIFEVLMYIKKNHVFKKEFRHM